MKQITFFIACLMAYCALAQDSIKTGVINMPPQYGSCDVREFLQRVPQPPKTQKLKSSKKQASEKEYILWIDRLTNLPEYLRDFYDRVGEDIAKVLNGEVSPLSMPELQQIDTDTYAYKVQTFIGPAVTFSYNNESEIGQKAYNAVGNAPDLLWDQFLSFIPYVCLSINMDKPEAFWLNTDYRYGHYCKYPIEFYPNTKTGIVHYELTVYLYLKYTDSESNYDIRREEFQTQTNITQGVNRFNTAIQKIFAGYPNEGSRYDKLLYLNDWLTSHNCYNSVSVESNRPDIAWSPLSALEGTVGENGPVCEGYSRAFKVLCDKKNIPCTLASGWACNDQNSSGEAHMWNHVKMGNGEWYAVDVTWNDPVMSWNAAVSGGENHDWFLIGSSTEIYPGFTYSESHIEDPFGGFTPNGSYSWNAVPGPTQSMTRYEVGNEDPDPDPDPDPDTITLEDITDLIDKYLAQ
ncbi:MAG: hypothetical protein IJT97_01565 [Bacteroidaceae bacterium]|nr:hypothetical protein [Bacteroidaceae bacterium]